MAENKIGSYLLYAIGEIMLVVIGILLALQIDNWNEERKDTQKENNYYVKLLEDLEEDMTNIQDQIKQSKIRISYTNDLIQNVQKENPVPKDIISAMFNSVSKITFTFKPSVSAFEDLKSSGNLNIIKDQKLKGQLIDYYTKVEGIVDVIDVNAESAVNSMLDKDRDFVSINWHNIDFIRDAIDVNKVDIDLISKSSPFTKFTSKKILNDAVLIIGNNARIKYLNLELEKEIREMRDILRMKVDKTH